MRPIHAWPIAIACALAAYWFLPADMPPAARRAIAICVIGAVLWATEAIPLVATSLLIIALQVVLLSELGQTDGVNIARFFEPLGSSTIILFLGGFLLAAAATKHGLDRAIASRLLRPFMTSSLGLIAAVTFIGGFLGMWMSNTATAAMMLAITAPIIRDEKTDRRLAGALAIATAFGPTLGALATPIATPPNAIASALLRAHGVDISFLKWMLAGTPLALAMLLISIGVIYLVMRPAHRPDLAPIERMSRLAPQGWITLGIMLAAITGWLTGPLHGLDDAAIAILAATALLVSGILNDRDIRDIDWPILILIWGGMALGQGLAQTGALEYIARHPMLAQSGATLALTITLTGIVLSTFLSNTATANLLIPVAIGLAGADSGRLGMIAGLSVSFALALPISSPPNAMAFATGKVTHLELLTAGSIISVIGVIAMMIGYVWILPFVLQQ